VTGNTFNHLHHLLVLGVLAINFTLLDHLISARTSALDAMNQSVTGADCFAGIKTKHFDLIAQAFNLASSFSA